MALPTIRVGEIDAFGLIITCGSTIAACAMLKPECAHNAASNALVHPWHPAVFDHCSSCLGTGPIEYVVGAVFSLVILVALFAGTPRPPR